MFSQLLVAQFLTLLTWIEAVSVGSISNVIFSSSTPPAISISSSCSQCICAMLFTANIVGVSCSPNHTCSFFYNYSRSYTLNSALNSSFHFLTLPPAQEQSTAALIQSTQAIAFLAVTTAPTASKSLYLHFAIFVSKLPDKIYDSARTSFLSWSSSCSYCERTVTWKRNGFSITMHTLWGFPMKLFTCEINAKLLSCR